MADDEKANEAVKQDVSGRRGFLFTVLGGVVAALSGWMAGAFPRGARVAEEGSTAIGAETRLSALEATVAQLTQQLATTSTIQPLAQLEGANNERVVFNKSELTVANPEGVLLNLVATGGHVGIRFYKDFGFGNERVTSPWHMGFIEGKEGYQGLAILRDWRFTAALWDEDGKLLLGRLHPHPPANDPAKARFHVRGTLDEVQAVVEASADQAADIFQVLGREGTKHLAVNAAGQVLIGSQHDPKALVLHDTQDGSRYSLRVTNGQLTIARV
jgi:hypothetical protein